MTGEIIKSFLVGLGFDVDDSSLAKFNKAIGSASLKVTALYTATKVAAAGIVYGISKISEGFEELGYQYRLIAPALNKTLLLRQEMMKAYSLAGVNLTKVIQQSVKLNFSLEKTRYAFQALYQSVGSRFFVLLTKSSDAFRNKLYANMPKIQNALERFVRFVFKALEATTALGARLWSILNRVYDFFVMLHKATDGWSSVIMGIIAAWKLLNLSFLATPLGMILAGLVGILALYDDFKTFQEGGKSFFNWAPVIPYIQKLGEVLGAARDVLVQIFTVASDVIKAFWKLAHLDFSGFKDAISSAFNGVFGLFEKMWSYIQKLFSFGGMVGEGIMKALGGVGGAAASASDAIGNGGARLKSGVLSALGENPGAAAANMGANAASLSGSAPLGSNTSNATTNLNVKQQTTISVQGSADASSTARTVANEQSRVNFDLVRNLKGATR